MDIVLEKIIKEMKSQNKKQYELTDFLGINRNSFGNWKAGLNKSYLKYLYGIANFLGVSVEYLKGETDQKESPAPDNSDETLLFALYGDDHADITPDMLAEIKEIAQVIRNRRKKDDK